MRDEKNALTPFSIYAVPLKKFTRTYDCNPILSVILYKYFSLLVKLSFIVACVFVCVCFVFRISK